MTPACDPQQWKIWIIQKPKIMQNSNNAKNKMRLSRRINYFWDFPKSWFVYLLGLFKRLYDHQNMLNKSQKQKAGIF